MIIEPAQPSAIAPIVVEAYALTDREQQIVRLVARGATTSELAENLFVSPHTVRDHIKAIFAKLEVSSRGELTAKLFADLTNRSPTTGSSRPERRETPRLLTSRGFAGTECLAERLLFRAWKPSLPVATSRPSVIG